MVAVSIAVISVYSSANCFVIDYSPELLAYVLVLIISFWSSLYAPRSSQVYMVQSLECSSANRFVIDCSPELLAYFLVLIISSDLRWSDLSCIRIILAWIIVGDSILDAVGCNGIRWIYIVSIDVFQSIYDLRLAIDIRSILECAAFKSSRLLIYR